jgi:hypothetical protein
VEGWSEGVLDEAGEASARTGGPSGHSGNAGNVDVEQWKLSGSNRVFALG